MSLAFFAISISFHPVLLNPLLFFSSSSVIVSEQQKRFRSATDHGRRRTRRAVLRYTCIGIYTDVYTYILVYGAVVRLIRFHRVVSHALQNRIRTSEEAENLKKIYHFSLQHRQKIYIEFGIPTRSFFLIRSEVMEKQKKKRSVIDSGCVYVALVSTKERMSMSRIFLG